MIEPRTSRERLEARRYRRAQWVRPLVGGHVVVPHRTLGPIVGGVVLAGAGILTQIVRWWI